jgi:hypothetical protein
MNLRIALPSLCAVASLMAFQVAEAVPLVPGVTAALPGTTALAQPELAGLVLDDKLFNFTMITAKGTVTGEVQSRVVRSTLEGTLDFYWRVMNDSSSKDDIAFFRVGLFNSPEYDANYRIDGVGDRAPISAFRFPGSQESFVNFDFTTTDPNGAPSALHPGESSYFMLMDTSATTYSETATMDVASFGTLNESQSFNTFTPSPVPEPETYALMGLGLLGMGALRSRRTQKS